MGSGGGWFYDCIEEDKSMIALSCGLSIRARL